MDSLIAAQNIIKFLPLPTAKRNSFNLFLLIDGTPNRLIREKNEMPSVNSSDHRRRRPSTRINQKDSMMAAADDWRFDLKRINSERALFCFTWQSIVVRPVCVRRRQSVICCGHLNFYCSSRISEGTARPPKSPKGNWPSLKLMGLGDSRCGLQSFCSKSADIDLKLSVWCS